jgi:hypothetical protein
MNERKKNRWNRDRLNKMWEGLRRLEEKPAAELSHLISFLLVLPGSSFFQILFFSPLTLDFSVPCGCIAGTQARDATHFQPFDWGNKTKKEVRRKDREEISTKNKNRNVCLMKKIRKKCSLYGNAAS